MQQTPLAETFEEVVERFGRKRIVLLALVGLQNLI